MRREWGGVTLGSALLLSNRRALLGRSFCTAVGEQATTTKKICEFLRTRTLPIIVATRLSVAAR